MPAAPPRRSQTWYRNRRAAAIVEYALAGAAVTLVLLAAASLLGAKSAGLVALTIQTQPDGHPTDNGPMLSQPVVELTAPPGPAVLDLELIRARTDNSRLSRQFGLSTDEFQSLIMPPQF